MEKSGQAIVTRKGRRPARPGRDFRARDDGYAEGAGGQGCDTAHALIGLALDDAAGRCGGRVFAPPVASCPTLRLHLSARRMGRAGVVQASGSGSGR